jgi:hypothetical protein
MTLSKRVMIEPARQGDSRLVRAYLQVGDYERLTLRQVSGAMVYAVRTWASETRHEGAVCTADRISSGARINYAPGYTEYQSVYYVAPKRCWHGLCIAGDCDGVHHVDATAYTWTEEQSDPNVAHADYPHWPGALYDCPACESTCYCAELNEGMLPAYPVTCVHCGGE